ncbi:MAG TPA: hypothetical protein VK369_05880 [Segetibacter sp.]|nr:hypothetical protein [Segetibacter sp.]
MMNGIGQDRQKLIDDFVVDCSNVFPTNSTAVMSRFAQYIYYSLFLSVSTKANESKYDNKFGP